jgi:hypothetical protein
MFPRIVLVNYVKEYILRLTFTDGKSAVMDFRNKVVGRGGVFKPLENVNFFQQVRVDLEDGTLVWPNDVDFDPDVLYSQATGTPLPALEKV